VLHGSPHAHERADARTGSRNGADAGVSLSSSQSARMRLAVVGGKLQGTEAAYLALKAGYEVVLIDRRVDVPAAGLDVIQHVMDITADRARSEALLGTCDAILPACEDEATLAWLAGHAPRFGVPLLFDLPAYETSSSKVASNQLFAELDVPRPLPWPDCGFPAVVKPSTASGSIGVSIVNDEQELAAARTALEADGHMVVVEEFVSGPSLSLEVIRYGGAAAVLQPTALEFDRFYDCKRVTAPVEADPALLAAFSTATELIAEGIDLEGLMDIEVMVHGLSPKVIEIDARVPSQTPTAVLHSCDVNIVAVLAEAFMNGELPAVDCSARRGAVYQHVLVENGTVEVLGEHVMGSAGPLTLMEDFFGCHEALTNYRHGATRWAATLISRGDDLAQARKIADEAVEGIAKQFDLQVLPKGESRD